MTTSTADNQPRIDRLIRITQALGEIFAQENRLISDNRSGDIAHLQSEKKQLATAYIDAIHDLAHDRTHMENADSDQLAQLRDFALALEERAVSQCDMIRTSSAEAVAS